MNTVGITALVPPELIFACNKRPCDINNYVPRSGIQPSSKLCSWTAIWREMIIRKEIPLDSLVVVAGGDCHNALVDGQKVELKGLRTLYFFYPFDNDVQFLEEQLEKLSDFLGGIEDPKMFKEVSRIKKICLDLDSKRVAGRISGAKAFEVMVSLSDLRGDFAKFDRTVQGIEEEAVDYNGRVALLGVPPIYCDFHQVLEGLGLHVVYDELPFEFTRLSGKNIKELANNYCGYTFSRKLDYRLNFIEKELKRRKIDGIIHYTQYACHHLLEDDLMRERLDFPFLTIQGDMPGKTPGQVRMRLEAFAEML